MADKRADAVFDVAIIGAGIGGLSAALSVSGGDRINLAVIEKNSAGSSNPTPLTFSSVLEEYRLMDCIKGRFASFGYHNYCGSRIRYDFDDTPLMALDYRKACMKILGQVLELKPETRIIKDRVKDIYYEGETVCLRLGGDEVLRARVLIDCSGRSRLVHRIFGRPQNGYYSHVFGGCFHVDGRIPMDTAYFLLPSSEFGSGGGWFYPLADSCASFGYATISTSEHVDSGVLQSNFSKALAKFQPYSDILRNARLEYYETGTIPISYIKQRVYPRILIAGDAAGMATNWTCMGIEPALQYGRLAGQMACGALMNREWNFSRAYQSAWEMENKEAYDTLEKLASRFWFSGHETWEWIIKNDLEYLTPRQLIGRIRWNRHMISKFKIFVRALRYKIKSSIDKSALEPRRIVVREHP